MRVLSASLLLLALALPAPAAERFTPSGAWRRPNWVRTASDGFSRIIEWSWPNSGRYADGQSAWVRLNAPAKANKVPRNSSYLEAAQFGFHIPARAVIRGIAVEIRTRAGRRHAGTTIDEAVVLMPNGVEDLTSDRAVRTALPRKMSTLAYGGPTDLWSIDEKLTPDRVNETVFGVAFVVSNQKRPAAAVVDAIRMAIFYDLP